MKILLPVDGSDYTKRMLGYVAAHDELVGRAHEFIAFNAVAPVPHYAARFLDRGILESYYAEQADIVLSPVKKFGAQNGWNLRAMHSVGHPVEAIAAIANGEKPDLIVMGTHGHTALAKVMLGSVASGVLARCHRPVLLIP